MGCAPCVAMTPNPAVLVGLRAEDGLEAAASDLEGWVRRLGFEARFSTSAHEVRSWLDQADFAATFVHSDLGVTEGQAVWRTLRPATARRTVLLTEERRRELWFEALRAGMATVLTLPLVETTVRAALEAVVGRTGAPPRTSTR